MKSKTLNLQPPEHSKAPTTLKPLVHAIHGTTSAAGFPPPWVGVVAVLELGGLAGAKVSGVGASLEGSRDVAAGCKNSVTVHITAANPIQVAVASKQGEGFQGLWGSAQRFMGLRN